MSSKLPSDSESDEVSTTVSDCPPYLLELLKAKKKKESALARSKKSAPADSLSEGSRSVVDLAESPMKTLALLKNFPTPPASSSNLKKNIVAFPKPEVFVTDKNCEVSSTSP
jgi:hypothetical protein